VTEKQELPVADDTRDIYPLEWLARAIDSARRARSADRLPERRETEAKVSFRQIRAGRER
jgi:hypothetical protein